MAQAYTPGLKVTPRIRHRVRRVLPITGDVLVQVGDSVSARDVVAQTFMPGDVTPINLANLLSLPPSDVPECMLKKEGDRVEIGEVIARSKGIFGMFKSEYKAKVSGTLETISPVTGQLIVRGTPLPVEITAYLSGEVVEVIENEGVVIEADASFLQGIFGIGGETFGPIRIAVDGVDEELTAEHITSDMKDTVVVGGARMTGQAIKKAIEVGAVAVIAGGMDDQDLKDILGYDLGVAITGSEQIGITLIITEGFGDIAMAERTFALLKSREGDEAAVNGATQIRAGVMRPEIVIPLSAQEKAAEQEGSHSSNVLDIGTPVRVIRDPYFGRLGTVAALPAELRQLGSESKARVLKVRFDGAVEGGGEDVVVPRANVEMIGE